MDERAQGLVLRVHPLTETSLIVRWITREHGRIATVAKGARRPKSPFRGKIDLFYLADFTFSRSRRSDLHNLREVSVCETHPFLRKELAYLRQASYCAALIEQATEMETPLPSIFELMVEMLRALHPHPPRPQTVLAFELKLLNELGLKPELGKSNLTAGARQVVQVLNAADWPSISRLKLSTGQSTELRQFLHAHLIFHLGRIPAVQHME